MVIRRWWLPVATAMALGAIMGGYWAGELRTSYESEAIVLVGPIFPDADLLEGTADLARTYGEVVESSGTIARAAAGTGVRPSDVGVSAQAGRSSATLTIRVRTPSRTDTPVIAGNIIEVLREVVADNRALVPAPAWATVDDTETGDTAATAIPAFPIGAAITVLDAGDRPVKKSLDAARAAAFGAFGAGMLAFAAGLTIESRRRAHPWSAAVTDAFGADLGIIPRTPFVADRLPGEWRRKIARDTLSDNEVQLVAEQLWLFARERRLRRAHLIALVAAPSDAPHYVRALWQLSIGLSRPPLVLDPTGRVSRWLLGGDESTLEPSTEVTVDGETIAWLVSTGDVAEMPALAGVTGRPGESEFVLVFAPVNSPVEAWWPMAEAVDCALVLVNPSDLRSGSARSRLSRLRRLDAPILGAAVLLPRWFRRPLRRVEIVDRVGMPTEPRTRSRRAGRRSVVTG